MTLLNPGFEEAGIGAGEATGWTHVEVSTAATLCLFDVGASDVEGFLLAWESVYQYELVRVVDTSAALYDGLVASGEPVEDFAEGWLGNQNYLWQHSGGGSTGVEDFSDWSGTYFEEMPASTTAIFDGEGVEDFAEGWLDNENYEMELGATTAATYTLGDEEAELFGPLYQDRQILAQSYPTNILYPANDIGTVPHGLENGWVVTVYPGENGLLPGGLNDGVAYYVQNVDTLGNTFQLSMSEFGAVVDLSTTGAGAFFVRGDPDRFWLLEP
jgi:hypothetical protein